MYSPASTVTKIGYSKKLGKKVFAGGILCFFLKEIITTNVIFEGMIWGIGVALIAKGVIHHRKVPYFTVDDNELCIYNPMGKKIRIYRYEAITDLSVKDNKIYLNSNESEKEIPIKKWETNPDDWHNLMLRIGKQPKIN